MSHDTEKFIKDTISSHKIVIFSKSYCPYCDRAKEVFKKMKQDYFTLELDEREDGDNIQKTLYNITSCKTVPQVFVHEQFIGGSTDVKEKYANGKLLELLSSEESHQ